MVTATRVLAIQVLKRAARKSLRRRMVSPPAETVDYSPYQIPNILPENCPNQITETETHKAISKVFLQLGLGEPASKQPPNNLTQTAYKVPSFPQLPTPQTVDPIIPVPRFKFNKNNYEITDEELRNAPGFVPNSRILCVEPSTPYAQTPSDLKGVSDDLLAIAIPAGINRSKKVYGCKYFSLKYWNESHFMGRIRKSKPGLMLITSNVNMLNIPGLKVNLKADLSLKSYPFKFSVIKSQTRKLVRSIFHRLYFNDKSLVKTRDGLYQLVINITPRQEDEIKEFEALLKLALNKVKKLDKRTLMKDVEYTDKRIDWNHVSTICKQHNHPILSPPINMQRNHKIQPKGKRSQNNPALTKQSKGEDHPEEPIDLSFFESAIKAAKKYKSPLTETPLNYKGDS